MNIRTPDYDNLVKPFKMIAKWEQGFVENMTCTDAQHKVARELGHQDWQSFTYYLKGIADQDVGFNKEQWWYVFDTQNGSIYKPFHKSQSCPAFDHNTDLHSLLINVVDNDIYNCAGYHYFKEMSKYGEKPDYEENYEPSNAMRNFIEKIRNLTETQALGVFAGAALFWDKFGFDVPNFQKSEEKWFAKHE
jgi:hypothetical protein